MKRLSIAYITPEDPRTKRSWSGTNYYLMKAIEKYVGDVEIFGPLSAQPEWTFCSAFNYLSLKLFGKRYNYRDSYIISRSYARRISKKLNSGNFDLIVAPAGTATTAKLKTNIPIVYINDRCVSGALDYHKILTNLYSWSRKESIKVEEMAVSKSLLSIYSSHWAGDAAKEIYQNNSHKIHVVSFGGNFDISPSFNEEKEFPPQKLRLLFAGVNWKEKGGAIAFEALNYLLQNNINAQLIVCGCIPPDEVGIHPNVLVEGFLNKDNPQEYAKLQSHFLKADFFILPTRFEAYGLVFCESAAYGLPALATRTGGIPTIVQDDETGFLFEMNERGDAYGKRIMELLSNPDKYYQMRISARKKYEEVLNWDAFGRKIQALLSNHFSNNER